MINFKEYLLSNDGKQVLISTLTGKVEGILSGEKMDKEGNVTALVVKQYLHRTEVSVGEILNIRIV